jgi:hypothetical protein
MIQSQDANDKDGNAIMTQLNYFTPPSKPAPACVALFPDLFKVYEDNRESWERTGNFYPYSVTCLFTVLGLYPSVCVSSQLHDSASDFLNRNEKIFHTKDKTAAEEHVLLDAFFGDSIAFGTVLQHYQDGMKPGGDSYQGDKDFLASISYNGRGGKLQGIIDNQNSAKFDFKTGQWIVTAPANYTNTAADPWFMGAH